jgi:hypothetical protein
VLDSLSGYPEVVVTRPGGPAGLFDGGRKHAEGRSCVFGDPQIRPDRRKPPHQSLSAPSEITEVKIGASPAAAMMAWRSTRCYRFYIQNVLTRYLLSIALITSRSTEPKRPAFQFIGRRAELRVLEQRDALSRSELVPVCGPFTKRNETATA